MSATEFWKWFRAKANAIASNPESASLIDEVDRRIRDAWPGLSWEIGPDVGSGWYLALSPNLDRNLAAAAERAAQGAPHVAGWRVLSTRPARRWQEEFELETRRGRIKLALADWRFVMLRYPDGERELVLIGHNAAELTEDERWHAAAIVLEGLLGEQTVLEHIDTFALVPEIEPRHMARARPLSLLRGMFHLP